MKYFYSVVCLTKEAAFVHKIKNNRILKIEYATGASHNCCDMYCVRWLL